MAKGGVKIKNILINSLKSEKISSMISFDNVSKGYGAKVLFENASFNINKSEKIGLVGRNGYGKTTLMRMVTGEESCDGGRISIPKNYFIGSLKQHIAFSKPTVIEEAESGAKIRNGAEIERWKAEKILFGLGFSEKDMRKSPQSFSGGFQVRLNLASALLSEPNILLLDEPTNYLDIVSLRWLKNFLISWRGELLLITHDRQFMDDIITHTVGIHRNKVRKIAGKTDKFYEQIAKDEEIYEKTRVNDEQKRKELERYISRFRAKARLAGLVQSRIKTLNKMEKKEKLEEVKNLEFSFKYKPIASKQIMRAENISFGYESGKELIKDFSVIIGSDDRIAIIGKNGRGKSTLMRILAGALTANQGTVTYHQGCAKGYFEQTNISVLNPNITVEEEIQSVSDALDRTYVRNICGSMLFSQDEALKKIGVLSGGEKSRVLLGKIIAASANILMLDEPTNHLDMDACDSLMEALDNFQGALVMVTHNEMFLHSLANRLIVFQDEFPYIFEGSYGEFLEKEGWKESLTVKEKSPAQKLGRKDIKRLKVDIIAAKNREIKPLEERSCELETKISEYEDETASLNQMLIDASEKGDGVKIGEYGKRLAELEKLIDEAFDALDTTVRQLDAKKEEFEKRLADISE